MGKKDGNSQSLSKSIQQVRKRELDRVAQRASRDRARNRLAFLEEKVAIFEASDKNQQVADLMDALTKSREENARLRAVLRRIRAYTHVDATDDAQDEQSLQPLQPGEDDTDNNVSLIYQDWGDHEPDAFLPFVPTPHLETSRISSDTGAETFTSVVESTYVDSQRPAEVSTQHDIPTDNFPQQQVEDGRKVTNLIAELFPTQNTRTPMFINACNTSYPIAIHSAFFEILNFDPKATFWPQEQSRPPSMGLSDYVECHFAKTGTIDSQRRIINERAAQYQAPFKPLFSGWDIVDAKSRTDPMWLSLRYVDEKVYTGWTMAKKIAVMFISHRLIQYHSDANLARVPEFLHPRPSQQEIQHPPIIDFLVWPGLRERLVFTHHRYSQTGELGPALCAYSQFHWPFPDEKIVTLEQPHGWKISELFQSYAFKIENWSMDEEFFQQFPEMKNDIPCALNTPGFALYSQVPGLHSDGPFCS